MENTGYIALSRQTALWRRMDTIANNLANMNTTGYRGQDMMFTDYLVRTPNTDSAFRDQVRFVQDMGQVNDLTPGPQKTTGNSMDVALQDADTFFAVEAFGGEKYTRAGGFTLDDQGKLVTRDGAPVLSENGTPIFIAPNESQFTVSETGTVSTENGAIAKLKVVRFDNPQALRRVGSSLWEANTDQTAQPAATARVAQGFLESSNVNGVVEMTRMIDVQRSYQQTQNILDREDERIRKTIDIWTRRSA
ncbi:flagellar basal-body rod protein FlgF [Novispirillum itersonii]|uniref:Flagellar basal-body rod protein FlgF n=1 Tax=Novispirillum itersonii TaxID=189 RepID=A0A7W9ZFE2_NOVIT|nr:flagellar basal-body rod protein FlgF [Novispirillum itersonii]MBB6209279.1 flagellar basal-body rod protein FlgF [Novispirillum itersonii]